MLHPEHPGLQKHAKPVSDLWKSLSDKSAFRKAATDEMDGREKEPLAGDAGRAVKARPARTDPHIVNMNSTEKRFDFEAPGGTFVCFV